MKLNGIKYKRMKTIEQLQAEKEILAASISEAIKQFMDKNDHVQQLRIECGYALVIQSQCGCVKQLDIKITAEI